MHILVTDRLACPRCGPGYGLVLLADELHERRVLDGGLGCPNCRDRYPIEGGFADLRPAPRSAGPEGGNPVGPLAPDDPEAALRLAAFLGVERGPGLLLLHGPSAGHAERVAAMVADIEVLAAHPDLADVPQAPGVSRIRAGHRLPLQSASLRGVLLESGRGSRLLDEAVRTLAPGARLVLLRPGADAARKVEAAGLELLLEADAAVVGVRK